MYWIQSSNSSSGFISATLLLMLAILTLSSYSALNFQLRAQLRTAQLDSQLQRRTQAATWGLVNRKSPLRMLSRNEVLSRGIAEQTLPLEETSLAIHIHWSESHPLPRWSKLATYAKGKNCFGILSNARLASCLSSASKQVAFFTDSLEVKSVNLDSAQPVYFIVTGKLEIKELHLDKAPLHIIAADSVSVEKTTCATSNNSKGLKPEVQKHATLLYSAGGQLRLPKSALGCLNDCSLLAYAAKGVFLGSTRYRQKPQCVFSPNIDLWAKQKAVGRPFLIAKHRDITSQR